MKETQREQVKQYINAHIDEVLLIVEKYVELCGVDDICVKCKKNEPKTCEGTGKTNCVLYSAKELLKHCGKPYIPYGGEIH